MEAYWEEYAFQLQLEELKAFSSTPQHPNPNQDKDGQGSAPLDSIASTSGSLKRGRCLWNERSDQEDDVEHREGKRSIKQRHTSVVGSKDSSELPIKLEVCPICMDSKPIDDIFTSGKCNHGFCLSCILRHVQDNLQSKKVPIRCPGVGCQEHLIANEFELFIPKECFDTWMDVLAEVAIPDSERIYCPYPDCSTLLSKPDRNNLSEDNEDIEASAECPSCHRLMCFQCLVPWHADMRCSDYQDLPLDERNESDMQFRKLTRKKKWQHCAKCKRIIELTQGCHHMTCRCGYEFCYICGSKWKEIHDCVQR